MSNADGTKPAPRRPLLARIALVAATVIAVDQTTKSLVVSRIADEIVPVFWTLQLNVSLNSGVAFSQGQGLTPVIIVLGVMLVVGMTYLSTKVTNPVVGVALALVIGGACGNLADRLFRAHGGAVVDFIDFQWWPVFNVADIAVSCGAVLLVLATIREKPPETSPGKAR